MSGFFAPVRFARMAGSSLAQPDAAVWVTDLLNAAYGRRSPKTRKIEDLRLAWLVLATYQASLNGRRLRATDLPAIIRAFGLQRWRPRLSGWLTLEPDEVLHAGLQLCGPWFADAVEDPALRGWGVAFETPAARAAYDPARRLRHAAIGALTPPRAAERIWHTYAPVPAGVDGATLLATLRDASDWPEWASSLGRFTALRPGPTTAGQTFEIDVVADLGPVPVLSRGYVTVTAVLAEGDALDERLATVAGHLGEAPVPENGTPRGLIELTTHDGHFLGRAVSRLIVWDEGGHGWVRDVGEWDPLPAHLAATYRLAGHRAQERFWGPATAADPDGSMLAQLARDTTARHG